VVSHNYYAAYEVTFTENSKWRKCHILKDNDEHPTFADSPPRQRLMDAMALLGGSLALLLW